METTGATGASAPRFVPTWVWREVPDGVVLPPGLDVRMDMATGRNWARLPDPAPSQPPEWTDDRAWLAHLKSALTSNARVEAVLAWGRAAGCQVDTTDEQLGLTLPKGLTDCPAKFTLQKQARDVGILIRPTGIAFADGRHEAGAGAPAA